MSARAPEGHELHRLEVSVSGLPERSAGPITARLREMAGVRQVVANPITERVLVLFDPAVVGINGIFQVFEREGLDVEGTVARWHLRIAGLACDWCARRVEEAVSQLLGVTAAIVNRATESLTVELVVGQMDARAVWTALLAQGFDPGPSEGAHADPPNQPRAWHHNGAHHA